MSKTETKNAVLPRDLAEANGTMNQIVENLNEQIHNVSDEQFERLKNSISDYFESFFSGPEDWDKDEYKAQQRDEALVKITLDAMTQARALK